MTAPPRRVAWIIPPPEMCCLCREPMTRSGEASSWNGSPAHRDCVRIQLMQQDPAFRETEMPGPDPPGEEGGDPAEGAPPRDDDEGDFG